jgi:hypothetical protein
MGYRKESKMFVPGSGGYEIIPERWKRVPQPLLIDDQGVYWYSGTAKEKGEGIT